MDIQQHAMLDHRLLLTQDFALINPLQVEASQWQDLDSEALTPKPLASQAHLMPRLVVLRDVSEARRVELIERSDRWARDYDLPLFSALLQTTAPRRRIISHLVGKMLLTTPLKQQMWLRFHDPRVIQQLSWQWSDDQLRILLGPIDAWTWCDPLTSHWRTLGSSSAQPLVDSQIRLSTVQRDQLHRMELLNRSCQRLARRMKPESVCAGLAQRLDLRLKHAIESMGLRDQDDIRLYAEHAVQYGPHLHLHPDMQSRLESAQREELSYTRACVGMDDAELRRLADEVAQRERTLQ